MCVCFCKLQTPCTSPCKTGLQMVYCIPVGDETGHEMGIRRIRFWCFLKKWKSSNDHPRHRLCCMHVSRVIFVRQFQKIPQRILKRLSPVASRGEHFPLLLHPGAVLWKRGDQGDRESSANLWGATSQRWHQKNPMEWCSVYVSLRDPWDWYIYIYISTVHEWKIFMWSM